MFDEAGGPVVVGQEPIQCVYSTAEVVFAVQPPQLSGLDPDSVRKVFVADLVPLEGDGPTCPPARFPLLVEVG